MRKYKINVGDEVLYKNYISEVIGMSIVASDEAPMYFIETKMGGSIMQEWVCGSEIKLLVEEEIKLETKYKIYMINDTNTGECYFQNTRAFKGDLIKAILEDIRVLAEFDDYDAMALSITKLDIVIMYIDDVKLSDIIIHIASEYDYEVYDKITKEEN